MLKLAEFIRKFYNKIDFISVYRITITVDTTSQNQLINKNEEEEKKNNQIKPRIIKASIINYSFVTMYNSKQLSLS